MSFLGRLLNNLLPVRRRGNRQRPKDRCDSETKVSLEQTETTTTTQETLTDETFQSESPSVEAKQTEAEKRIQKVQQLKAAQKEQPRKEKPNIAQSRPKNLIRKPLSENEQTEFEKVNVKLRPAVSRKSSKSEDRDRAKKGIERLMIGRGSHHHKKKKNKLICPAKTTDDDGTMTTTTTTTTTTLVETAGSEATAEANEANKVEQNAENDKDDNSAKMRKMATENYKNENSTKTACTVPFPNMAFQIQTSNGGISTEEENEGSIDNEQGTTTARNEPFVNAQFDAITVRKRLAHSFVLRG
ncbi:hypothetical protein Tcan_16983 [Toxocara canis]|uniref:Uncharacterized protein n=1 Tax=Toxocara canis TaxID=6265 RepID=A0A0B2V9V8_TOXCA|nr:hypothetical protein Tcan_16983 [Toxocara canis]